MPPIKWIFVDSNHLRGEAEDAVFSADLDSATGVSWVAITATNGARIARLGVSCCDEDVTAETTYCAAAIYWSWFRKRLIDTGVATISETAAVYPAFKKDCAKENGT